MFDSLCLSLPATATAALLGLAALYLSRQRRRAKRESSAAAGCVIASRGTQHCDARFRRVAEAFRQNFADGWEEQGAALAVYYRGQLVVDVWDGYADVYSWRAWHCDTLTTCFSTTKGLCSLAIAKLVSAGRLQYDTPLVDFWPEFGVNGKETTTVKHVVQHQAGLPFLVPEPTAEQVGSGQAMRALLQSQTPLHAPGAMITYHALTHGWLCDQIVRSVDGRSIADYIQQEIVAVAGDEEFYIGLPVEQQHRLSRLNKAGLLDGLYHFTCDASFARALLQYVTGTLSRVSRKALFEPTWLLRPLHTDRIPFNNPDINRLEMASISGYGTARALALAFASVQKLLSKDVLLRLREPVIRQEYDYVMTKYIDEGHGFVFSRNPKDGGWIFGHPGHGGQNVKVDVDRSLAFAYVTNSLKIAGGDLTRTFARLQQAIYDCVDE